MIKDFVDLTKPGIIIGNIISCTGGFFLAAKGGIHFPLLVFTWVSMILVIAAACVMNNIYDRDIDQRMARTSTRPLVTGEISTASAFLFGLALLGLGLSGFYFLVTLWAFYAALAGFLLYVFAYTMWTKRHTIWSTEVGSLSGACPPLAGYFAVSSEVSAAPIVLFLIMAIWQMPHTYAIGMMRKEDFIRANIPVFSVVRSFDVIRIRIAFYQVMFVFAIAALFIVGAAGYFYFIIMLGLSLYWLLLTFQRAKFDNETAWAGKLFGHSLIIVMALSALISLDYELTSTMRWL
ncbi:MAG: heme o synthase [Pseudomonadota bacterium]|nr:heme o synthase [Pseudomonadota bacterium]